MSSGDSRDGARISHKARVFRAGNKLHFGWDNHGYSVLQSLYEQAREGVNTDVIVQGQNPRNSWHAHKCILSSASEYLNQHLKDNESSCGKHTLILEKLPNEYVPLLLQYVYLGWVEIPLGPSVGVWESLMRQMAIDIHLPSTDMDKGVEEFVALPMQPTKSPVNHTCDPNVRRPCNTEASVRPKVEGDASSARSSRIPLQFQSVAPLPDSDPVPPQTMQVYEEMSAQQLQRKAAEKAAVEVNLANIQATKEAMERNALQVQMPRYPQPATPPISPAVLGLSVQSHQQVAPAGMHHIPVQMVPGPSPYQILSTPVPVAQQHGIGAVSVVCTPPTRQQSVERPSRPLTPPERDALLVLGNLLPNTPSPLATATAIPTSTLHHEIEIKSEPGLSMTQQQPQPPPMPTPPQTTPPTPQSTPSPPYPPPYRRQQLAFPRQPDPVKNLLPSDVVLKQTVAMAEGKTWKIIPNGRIRVMISGPVEPLVQRDIDRLNLERETGNHPCFAVVDPNKDKKAKAGRGRFSTSANGEETKLVPANYVLDAMGREIWSTNNKQFVRCDLVGCTKVLTDPSSLYRHKKIHTKDKAHQCPLCTSAFIQRYNMRQHLGTHRNGHWNASDIYKIDEDLRGFFLAKMEHPLGIDIMEEEYIQALWDLRDKYLADRAAERASGVTRVRNRGGRRRGTTTRPTRTRAATEAVTMSTDAAVTLAPTDVSDAVSRGMAAAAAQQAALQQLNSNSPGESQQTEQVDVVGANVEVGGDSDTDSDGFVIDEDATVGNNDEEEMPMPSSTTDGDGAAAAAGQSQQQQQWQQEPPEIVQPPPSTPQEVAHQEAVNQEAGEASQAAEQQNTEEMKQQALWQREEIRKQIEQFSRANLPADMKEALLAQTQNVAAKLDADIRALYNPQ